MSKSEWTRDTVVRIGLGAVVVGVIAVVWTLVVALRVEPLPAPSSRNTENLAAIAMSASRPGVDLDAAVDGDIFSPDRAAPATRYSMPNEKQASDASAGESEKPVVLGTAVATDGRSFATLKLGEGAPTLSHVGDHIGDWTVRAIERGKVTLVSANGTRATVAVPKPGT